ncbi:MAG: hypothetical protein U1E60_32015 [Reyranellaceae bacterium]
MMAENIADHVRMLSCAPEKLLNGVPDRVRGLRVPVTQLLLEPREPLPNGVSTVTEAVGVETIEDIPSGPLADEPPQDRGQRLGDWQAAP